MEAVSETMFGRAIQLLLGDGWRGLMIACIIAGVTSAETIMVVGSGVFTRNFYIHMVPGADEKERLWVGRAAAGGMLLVGIALALWSGSITWLLKASLKVIALMGPAFWLGVTWRRANPAGVWCSLAAGIAVWAVTGLPEEMVQGIPLAFESRAPRGSARRGDEGAAHAGRTIWRPDRRQPAHVAAIAGCASIRSSPDFTPPSVARASSRSSEVPDAFSHEATLGLHGVALDYAKASPLAYQGLQTTRDRDPASVGSRLGRLSPGLGNSRRTDRPARLAGVFGA